MLLSLFTPTHRPEYLHEVHQSLLQQIGSVNWEWIIVPNGKAPITIPSDISSDPHVTVIPGYTLEGIGALKKFACSQCKGDVLVEMDHDDTLAPHCFEELAKAYTKQPKGFYYSDFINVKPNGQCETFSSIFGWSAYRTTIDGRVYTACRAFPPSARSLCSIFFCPNHVRAWSNYAYTRAGGHDEGLVVGDDHDLLCRTYIAGVPFIWIPEPLYIYRRQKVQSFLEFNKEIQIQQLENCHKYLHELITTECQLSGLPMLNIGRVEWCPHAFKHLDCEKLPFSHIPDSSIGCIRAFDALQLIPRDKIVDTMNELYRILVPGGWLMTHTPSVDDGHGKMGRGAFQDPSHVSYWSNNNFVYFTQKKYAGMLKNYKGRFQAVRTFTEYPSDWHQQQCIPYVTADLCALKGQRQPGECFI